MFVCLATSDNERPLLSLSSTPYERRASAPALRRFFTNNCQTRGSIADRCEQAYREGRITAVSLTSGVYQKDIDAEIFNLAECIREVRRRLPDIPIGVEPYASTEEHIEALRRPAPTRSS